VKEFLAETNILVSIIGICVMIISFFLVRTLRQVDRNQAKLFEKFEFHETRLSQLEGKHEAVMAQGGHKK
jgi:uncharacterized membrane protein